MEHRSPVTDHEGDPEGLVLELLAGELLHELEGVPQLGRVPLELEHVLLSIQQGIIFLRVERDGLLDINRRGFVENPLPFTPVAVEVV